MPSLPTVGPDGLGVIPGPLGPPGPTIRSRQGQAGAGSGGLGMACIFKLFEGLVIIIQDVASLAGARYHTSPW